MATLSEDLNNLYTTTWQNMKGKVADQIFDATPFWFWMRQNGGLESVAGGRFLSEPLRFAKSDNVAFVERGSTMSLADKEFLTIAHDNWRYLADSIVRFGVDDQQNRGKNQIISLMNSKLANSRDSLIDKMEETLAGTAQTGLAFNSLVDIVADDPTTGTLHNIDAAAETWWRSQTQDMASDSFATFGTNRMNKMVNSCSNNMRQDTPDIIMSGQQPFELYWEETLLQKQIHNKTMGDAGFQTIEFRGIPMVWSPQIPSDDITGTKGRIYFLNTRFLKFKYDPQLFFDMTEWKPIPSQVNDNAAQVVTAGNLMTSRRRVHGVMFDIDTE